MVTAFEKGVPWLSATVSELQENLAHLRAELLSQLPKARLLDMESTYLAWIDLRDYGVSNPAKLILDHGRVSLVAGHEHGGESYDQYVRFNFATSKPRITEAVRRMALVLEGEK